MVLNVIRKCWRSLRKHYGSGFKISTCPFCGRPVSEFKEGIWECDFCGAVGNRLGGVKNEKK